MEQNDFFPRFDEWHKHGIMVKGGLVFAPQDFFVSYGIDKTRTYFSWPEAMGFEEKILRPEGWRLPTAEEWEFLIEEKVINPINSKLALGLHGYIVGERMNGYRGLLSPSGIKYVSNIGQRGYYWSSSEVKYDTSLALNFGSTMTKSDLPMVEPFLKGFGRSVRCVAIN